MTSHLSEVRQTGEAEIREQVTEIKCGMEIYLRERLREKLVQVAFSPKYVSTCSLALAGLLLLVLSASESRGGGAGCTYVAPGRQGWIRSILFLLY